MPALLCASPHVPAEWVIAHGWRVVRAEPLPHATREGVCAHAQGVAGLHATAGDALALTAPCDQMRRAAETLAASVRPTVVLHPPAVEDSPAALALFRDDLRRLGRVLVGHGGHRPAPGELAEALLLGDARRAEVRAHAGGIPARAFTEAVARVQRGDPAGLPPRRPLTGRRIALLGAHLVPGERWLLDLLDGSGLIVALDGTDGGERGLPGPLDRRRVREDAEAAMVEAWATIPDPLRRPNDGFHRWLADAIAARDLAGLVVWRQPWCDAWAAELPRLRAHGLPLVDLVAGLGSDRERLRTRVEAFAETLG